MLIKAINLVRPSNCCSGDFWEAKSMLIMPGLLFPAQVLADIFLQAM